MLQLVRTDYVNRYHLYVDPMAAKFDAFRVELLEQSTTLTHDTVEALWSQVPAAVQEMRRKYDQLPLYHWLTFAPFARIVAVELARESAQVTLNTSMAVGECHPGHEERVRALGAALDAIEFLQSPPAKRPQAMH